MECDRDESVPEATRRAQTRRSRGKEGKGAKKEVWDALNLTVGSELISELVKRHVLLFLGHLEALEGQRAR